MEKSKFQFSNPKLTRLHFVVHDDFVKTESLDMAIHISVNCQKKPKADLSSDNSAYVTVTVSIGTEDNSTPFYIEADESANFRWEDNSFTEEQIDELLRQNAVALLISYLRPIIASITAASPFPVYNLPFINLT